MPEELTLLLFFFFTVFNVYSISIARLFSCQFTEGKINKHKIAKFTINKHTINRFKVVADKNIRKILNIVKNLIRRYVESRN
jgi:hypothetical protein